MGKVVRLAPALDRGEPLLVVEAEIQNPGTLRPGSFARAEIAWTTPTRRWSCRGAPSSRSRASRRSSPSRRAKAVEKEIATGRRGDAWIEIVTGLQAGDAVVLDPGNLQRGSRSP